MDSYWGYLKSWVLTLLSYYYFVQGFEHFLGTTYSLKTIKNADDHPYSLSLTYISCPVKSDQLNFGTFFLHCQYASDTYPKPNIMQKKYFDFKVEIQIFNKYVLPLKMFKTLNKNISLLSNVKTQLLRYPQ